MQKGKGLEEQEVTDAIQQFELGVDYYKGRNGKKQDRSKAVVWYRKSAEQGYHKAQFSLGYCYNYGKGVTRDYIEAVEWYKKAVEQGNAYAQYNLGVCYNNGEGVSKDKEKAISLWEESAKNGYEVARITLERIKDMEPNSAKINSSSVPKQYPIFISYKRVDKETVFSLKDRVERDTGLNCWIDLDGIESDQQFANVIINAINNAETVLFMYSKAHSLIEHYENDWTIRELNFAQEKGKRIVFVNVDKSPLTDWFRLMFGTKQQVDATSNLAISKLLDDLTLWTNKKEYEHIITTTKKERKEKIIYRILKWGKHHKIATFGIVISSIAFVLFFLLLNSSAIESPIFHRLLIWKKRYFNQYERIDLKDLSTGVLYGVHNAVDLGLSVKWSTTNVGADLPHFSGDYYGWGEIKTKPSYDWGNYAFGNDTCVTKYCVDEKYGTVDNLNLLTELDDVAAVKWKNGWRMPTYEEFNELRTKCTFEVRTLLGKEGYLFTGPNGNTIFFPLSGDVDGTRISGSGNYVIYWTSSLFSNNTEAYEFAISKKGYYWYNSPRYTGHNIRAVHK